MSTNKNKRNPINNVEDLLNEIARVDALREEQEEYLSNQYQLLKKKVEKPFRVMGNLFDFIPGANAVKSVMSLVRKNDSNSKADWLTKLLQMATPMVLNRTMLKNAGWLKKATIVLASETAVSQINKASIGSVVSGIANIIRPKKKTKKLAKASSAEITAEEAVESNKYGIPKDSETY